MHADEDIQQLLKDFPELEGGDFILGKEVLAHFGLLFSGFANLEGGLQNCYLFWQLHIALINGEVGSKNDWLALHSKFESEAFDATFGRLVNLLGDCPDMKFLADDLKALRHSRNYFAHRFFREENDKMFNDDAILKLMSRMNVLRHEVKKCEGSVENVSTHLFQVIYPNVDMKSNIAAFAQERMEEISVSPPKDFGWENE
ncbi:hypothetical protein HW561_04780 [Rhodobacteraceae bacterium B1Z28]|uniref:HEPN AbiU2-like domain-containing protein n=1 Tax=Ruegeria haliotis TaxID=2747601 RepID=A0ABX2PLW1_9RHOB|nr:hypothetical protein [Ruegeria haliotis]NVO55105.1 hypothetical protein [Ruegeria haliotis]